VAIKCSGILDERTASIFRVTELVQVDAEVILKIEAAYSFGTFNHYLA
jgi:hypothetical protein